MVIPVPEMAIVESDWTAETDRGGFGSTGK